MLIEIEFHILFATMHQNNAVKFLPSIVEDKKLEVSVEENEAILKYSTWTENLGWSCQKTMRVDAAMLDDLHRAISAARYKLNQRKTDADDFPAGNIIPFPTVA